MMADGHRPKCPQVGKVAFKLYLPILSIQLGLSFDTMNRDVQKSQGRHPNIKLHFRLFEMDRVRNGKFQGNRSIIGLKTIIS